MLTVHPHNILTGTNAQSRRYARNAQIVPKEETYIDDGIDHSGGPYFVETLTNEFIEHAWHRFLEMASVGGYTGFVESGRLPKEKTTTRKARLSEAANNKKS